MLTGSFVVVGVSQPFKFGRKNVGEALVMSGN